MTAVTIGEQMSDLSEFTEYRLTRIAAKFATIYQAKGRSAAASYASKEVPREDEQYALAPLVRSALRAIGVKVR